MSEDLYLCFIPPLVQLIISAHDKKRSPDVNNYRTSRSRQSGLSIFRE